MGRLGLRWACACVLVMPLIGCSDETTATPGDGGIGGAAGGTGGVGGTGGGTGGAELTVTVVEVRSFTGPRPAFEGAELCETDTTNCDTTEATGMAMIEVSPDEEISYTVSADGFLPYLLSDVTDETFRGTFWPMFSDELTEDFSDALMTPYPWTDGAVFLQVHPNMEGVTFELLNQAAKQYYSEEAEGDWSLDLTSTTSVGTGGFVEVPPGVYQVEFGGTATNCTPEIAWPGDAPNRIRVQVRVGHAGYGSMRCDEP